MKNITRHDMVLTGNGTAAGGVYNFVKIVGDQIVNGDLDCLKMSLVGTCDMDGNVKAESVRFTGTSTVRGKFEAEQLKLVGTLNIHGDAAVKELVVKGEVKVDGNVSIEKADIYGLIDAKGDCSTEAFMFKGPFNIGGLLNAGNIDVDLHCKCHVKEIGGEKINIRRGNDNLIKKIIKSIYLPHDFYEGQLITDTVEGDEIYLEHTKAKVVRGYNVKIGPGCEIGLVEYKNQYEQAEETSVKENRKI